MNADPMAVQNLFAQAVAIADLNQRQAFIREKCAHDAELLRRVEELLAAYDEPRPFFDQPTAQLGNLPASAPLQPTDAGQRPGSVVAGRYKLLEAIGEGGMGTVWVAEQTSPVRRKVALKLVKPGMDSRQVLARFDAERQALALMDHPNIAKVFDGGVTEQGRPFFAMEYVKGMPLTEYCDQTRLSLEERIKLFVPICQAVQHAHQKGIIHRDLKPSNVLICLYDGKPVPKVIDFGLAKAMYQPLTEHTLHTGHGLMIGTPLYMSPEQAEHNNLDVDTRTDIYSLGVMLYELLTGTTPLERAQFKEAALGEILRLIKEVEPPKPSTRVSTNMQRASIAAQRSLEPEQLGRSIRGDLDWIVMKALDKERDRRYETANGLARDLERFLNQEAVEACPPSTVYRLKKRFQKHRAAISTAAAFLLLVCAGAVISTWQAYRATKAEQVAVTAEATARQERDKALENERQAMAARTAESDARLAEERARLAESQQRAEADSQRIEAVKQRDEAQRLQQEAVARSTQLQQLTEDQRRAIYASDMNLVRIEAQRGNLQRMREILMAQLPIHGEEDLRGFEWNYWYRYLTQAQVLQKFGNFEIVKSRSAIVPGGAYVALTRGPEMETEIREAASGAIVGTLPVRLTTILVDRPRFSATGRSVHGSRNSMLAYAPGSSDRDPGKGTECTVYEPNGEKYTFVYPSESLSHVSFLNISRDGRFVAALGNDVSHQQDQPAARLLIWNVDTQELVLNQVQSRELNRIEFSPDGSMVVAYLCHGTKRYSDELRDVAVVMDVATGEERGIVRHNDDLDDVYWLPDHQRLLLSTLGFSGPNRLELLSWTIGADQPQRLSQETMPNYIKGAVSPDGRLLAVTGHTMSSIRIIDTTRGHVVHTLHNEATTIHSLTFSTDGQSIVACSMTGEVLRWDLSQSRDLFALRTNPLRQVAAINFVRETNGFALSPDQSLMAVAHADNSIVIRTKEGQETVLKRGIPNSHQGTSLLHFSHDGRYLAHQSSIGPDGTSLRRTSSGRIVKNGYLLELYDVLVGKRLWQVVHSTALMDTRNYPMEFDADQRNLVVMDGRNLRVMNCETGLSRSEPSPQDRFRLTNFSGSILVREPMTGRVLIGGIAIDTQRDKSNRIDILSRKFGIVLVDAFTNETVRRFDLPMPPGLSSPRVVPSPDGLHAGVLTRMPDAVGRVEIWNLREGKQVLDSEGSAIQFSADGTLAAIIFEDKLTDYGAVSARTSHIREVTVWEIRNLRQLCKISLLGNRADQIRFSPHGNRLLTLHGKYSSGDGGSISQGKLWDLTSGREILTIPVAHVNNFNWDLIFDATGNQLTSFLLGKTDGTGGGGVSVVHDATPLAPQDDARIIANRLIESLIQETPLPSEVVTEINVRKGLKPLVRETALALAAQSKFDPHRVADLCKEIVTDRNKSREDYDRALRWSEALCAVEPDARRSKALLGAAQFRCGLIQDCLQTLDAISQETSEPQSEDAAYFELLRRAIQLLALHQSGETERTPELMKSFMDQFRGSFDFARTSSGAPSSKRMLLFSEVRSTLPRDSFPTTVDMFSGGQIGLTDDIIAKLSKILDLDSDGRITEQEVTSSRGSNAWSGFEHFDADHDKVLTPEELGISYKVILLVQMGNRSIADMPASLSSRMPADVRDQSMTRLMTRQLSYLDEALSLAPDYPPGLNAKAWLLATSPSDQIRNGAEAVKLAQRACELTKMKNAAYLETLAASHAETRNFDEAIQYQQLSLPLQSSVDYLRAINRLTLYRGQQSLLDLATKQSALQAPEVAFSDENSATLLAPDVVQNAPRLDGMHGVSWASDSQRLVLGRPKDGTQEAELHIVDRASGEVKSVLHGGVDPSWSPIPNGPIAFVRANEGQPVRPSSQEIWLVNSDGSNLRKLSQGGSPSWSRDGRLFFFGLTSDHGLELRSLHPDEPTNDVTVHYEIDGYPTVSPDGTLVAYSMPGKLIVRRLTDNTETLSFPLAQDELVHAGWSPDGRFVVATSATGTHPGVWLIEVASGKRRMLGKLNGVRSAWSPDGGIIAVEESVEKKIMLLDVHSLDFLREANPTEATKQP